MAEETETPRESEVGGEDIPARNNGKGASSLLEQLREQRAKLGQKRNTVLEIPGYNGMLFARYKYVGWDKIKAIVDQADKSKNARAELYGQCDVLAAACEEILVREEGREDVDAEGYAPVNPEIDYPTRYDENLSKALGFESIKAREVILGVFRNELAVSVHQGEFMEWAASNQAADDEEFAGESKGT